MSSFSSLIWRYRPDHYPRRIVCHVDHPLLQIGTFHHPLLQISQKSMSSFSSPVLTDRTASTLLAQTAPSPMLADPTASAVLAPAAPSPMLAPTAGETSVRDKSPIRVMTIGKYLRHRVNPLVRLEPTTGTTKLDSISALSNLWHGGSLLVMSDRNFWRKTVCR